MNEDALHYIGTLWDSQTELRYYLYIFKELDNAVII